MMNHEDYLEKFMDHINNGPYQLIKEHPTTNIKTKTFKPLKVLKDNEFIESKLYYYLIPADSPEPYTNQDFLYVLLFHIVAPRCTMLTNIYLTFLRLLLKIKITTSRILPRFPITSEMFPLKMKK